jgi:nucleoside phosphorylase
MPGKSLAIGIVTALEETELPAVKAAFGISEKAITGFIDDSPIWHSRLKSSDDRPLDIYVACANESGNTGIVFTTQSLIREMNLFEVFLVGIGCGIRTFCPTDVLVSDAVLNYEYLKLTDGGAIDRSRFITPTEALVKSSVSIGKRVKWQRRYLNLIRQRAEDFPQLRRLIIDPLFQGSTVIASGEKVIADGLLERLRQKNERIRLGEMEAYGFARACTRQNASVGWLVVRGVSDYGDSSKDQPNTGAPPPLSEMSREQFRSDQIVPLKDEYHFAAALSASTFLREFLEERRYSHAVTHQSRQSEETEKISKTRNHLALEIDDWESSGAEDEFRTRFRLWRLLMGIINFASFHQNHAGLNFVGANFMFLRKTADGDRWVTTLQPGDIVFDNTSLVLTIGLATTGSYFINDFQYSDYYVFIKEDVIEAGGKKRRLGLNGRTIQELFLNIADDDQLHTLSFPTLKSITERVDFYNTTLSVDSGFQDMKFGYGIRLTGNYAEVYRKKAAAGYKRGLAPAEEAAIKSIINIPVFAADEDGIIRNVLGVLNLDYGKILDRDKIDIDFFCEIQRLLNRTFSIFIRKKERNPFDNFIFA